MQHSQWTRRIRRFVLAPLYRAVSPQRTVVGNNRRLRVDLTDRVVATDLYVNQEYEPHIEQLMAALDLRGKACVDVGANIGIYATFLSELVGPQGRVYAIEPEPHNYSLLRANLDLAGARNVRALQVAAGASEAAGRVVRNESNYGDHRVSKDATEGDEVRIRSVDEIVADEPDGAIGLIKIDVQGFEAEVARGLARTIARNPDVVVIIELFPDGLHAAGATGSGLVSALREMGLDGWEYEKNRILPLQESYVYDLFRGGAWTDLVLSRNPNRLRAVLATLYPELLR